MKQQLIDNILSTNLSENTKASLINGLTDRYLIQPHESEIRPGDSKIGGFPHLPKDFEYPQEADFFYEFVAQINLVDLVDCDLPFFPKTGILYFFIDDDFNVPNVNTKVFLLNPDISGLEVKRPPQHKKSRCESFLDRTERTELKLKISKSYTVDQDLLSKIKNEDLTEEMKTNGFDLEDLYTKNQIWGYTTSWGGLDGSWSAWLAKERLICLYWHTVDSTIEYLRSQNIDFKAWLHSKVDESIKKQKENVLKTDRSAFFYPYEEQQLLDLEYAKFNLDNFIDNFELHKAESKKWQMLISMSSFPEAGIAFGDGKIEFYINMDDLKHLDFSNIYCHIYN